MERVGRAAIVLATSLIAATLLALPAAGELRLPPEDDGSTFTWPGATTVTVASSHGAADTFEARRT